VITFWLFMWMPLHLMVGGMTGVASIAMCGSRPCLRHLACTKWETWACLSSKKNDIGGSEANKEVMLLERCEVHIVPWGLYAPAKVVGSIHGQKADAEIYPKVELVNQFSTQKLVKIYCMVKDQAGRLVMDQAGLETKYARCDYLFSLIRQIVQNRSRTIPYHTFQIQLDLIASW